MKLIYIYIYNNNFKMIDHIPVNDHIHIFQNLIHEIHIPETMFSELYQISYLLDGLPPS